MATINIMGIVQGVKSFDLTAGSTSDIYGWSYQINGGSWVTIYPASTTSKKNVSTTIKGLTPDTEYTIRVRARTTPSSSNASYIYRTETSRTLRRQILASVNPVLIDAENPTITFSMQFNDNSVSNWELCVYADETTEPPSLIPFTGNTTGIYTVSVSSALADYIMQNRMANKSALQGEFDVIEQGDPDPQGSLYRTTGKFVMTAANSGPVFTTADFEYGDRQLDVNRLLGTQVDRGTMLQNASQPSVYFRNATARNGANIVSASATIEETTYTEEWVEDDDPKARLNMPEIKTSGEVTITARVTDSRGFYTEAKKTFNSLPYNKISFDSYRIARVNGVEDNINANIYGTWSSIKPAGTELNSLRSFSYRYKQLPNGTWSSATTITPTTSQAGMFEFIGFLISLSADYSYEFSIRAYDEIRESQATVIVNRGTPLMSFRDGLVGVLTNNPAFPFDVNGLIGQNGKRILGFVRQLTSEDDLDDITDTGIYTVTANVASTSLHYPIDRQGYLLCLKLQNNLYFQIYFARTNDSTLTPAVYIRTYYGDSAGYISNWFSFNLT